MCLQVLLFLAYFSHISRISRFFFSVAGQRDVNPKYHGAVMDYAINSREESNSAKWWFSLRMIWSFWGPGFQTS